MTPRAQRRSWRPRFATPLRQKRGLVLATSALAVMAMISTLATESLASWVTTEYASAGIRTHVLLVAEPTATGKTPIAVDLEWTVPDARGDERYTVERATSASGANAAIVADDLTDLEFTDEGPIAAVAGTCPTGSVLLSAGQCSLTQETDYWYRVSYTLGSWNSEASDWVKATTPSREALKATAQPQPTQLALNWDKAPYRGISAASYRLQRSLSKDGSNPKELYSGAGLTAVDKGELPVSTQPFRQIANSDSTVCALTHTGEAARCWGYIYYKSASTSYEFGLTDSLGGPAGAIFAQPVDNDAGYSGFCAVSKDGRRLACWQMQFRGHQPGLPGTGQAQAVYGLDLLPTASYGVATLTANAGKIEDVSLGQFSRCLLTASSQVFCWGAGYDGGLGDGRAYSKDAENPASSAAVDRPVLLQGVLSPGAKIVKVVGGAGFHCVLTSDGEVACWGETTALKRQEISAEDNRPWLLVPQAGVLGGEKVVDLGAGSYHLCARTSTGRVACWGNNQAGQLGTGSASSQGVPFATAGAEPVRADALASALRPGERVVQLDGGGIGYHPETSFSCARTNDRILCWGNNDLGQLGDGSKTRRLTPVDTYTLAADSPARIDLMALSGARICAQIVDDTSATTPQILCAGDNESGQVSAGAEKPGVPRMTQAPVQFLVGCPGGSVSLGSKNGKEICSLAPNTSYYYQVVYTLNGLEVVGEWVPIRTSSD
jgi:hypothetical protein